jgi:hypothetical protein
MDEPTLSDMMARIANEHLHVEIVPQADGSFYVWIEDTFIHYEGHAATIPAAFWQAYFKYAEAIAAQADDGAG